MLPLTVVILTYNEQSDLPGCLDSLLGVTDDIIVLDSFSTDGTHAVATERGIPVFTHHFSGFGDQRNWAIDHLPHKYSWVLHLDADERLTDAFIDELENVLSRAPEESGFYIPSKLMLGITWLRYSGGYPVYQVRLFHRGRLRFVNHGHGQREVAQGRIGYFKEPYLHFAFTKGLTNWFEKHARYAAAESAEATAVSVSLSSTIRAIAAGSPVERRRGVKQLCYYVPFRGLFRQFYMLIVKRGLLDGKAGIVYARMMAIYESMYDVFVAAEKVGLKRSK